MTNSARSEILARINTAGTHGAPASNADLAWEAVPRRYRQTGALSREGSIELFVERLLDYGATVDRCAPDDVVATVRERLHHRHKKRMLVSTDVDSAVLRGVDCVFVSDDALSYDEIDGCDGVLTGCAVAIALTGTLGLCHGTTKQAQGRRAITLIPDYHLCIVRAEDVVETVPEAMCALEARKDQPITLVSGPSATADIEMTRIQGVHGPRVLDVVLVI